MKGKDFKIIKQTKPFEFNDIFVYLALLLTLVFLFLAFIILPKKTDSNGFSIYRGEHLICSYTIEKNELIISDEFLTIVEHKAVENGVEITVYTNQNKTGYNVILINTGKLSANVIESTCSSSKDCVYSPEITKDGAIYCLPHGLKVVPLKSSGFIPPVSG